MTQAQLEQTLFRGSSSPIIIFGTAVVCGLVAAASLVAAFVFQPYAYGLLALAVLALAYIAFRYLLVKVRIYEVTTERIRVTDGLLTRRTDEVELYRVKDSILIQPLVLRMFSLGNIEVITHDASTPVVSLRAIRRARALREEMRKSIEICRDRKRVRLAELE